MGCHQSTPVPRIKQDPKEPADSDQTTNDSFHELSDNFNLTGRSQGTPRTACSFGFLIEQTENYQIYEYMFQDEIGKGSTTRVYQVLNVETNQTYAAKVYSKSLLTKQVLLGCNSALDNLKEEIEVQSKMNNPYVLPIIEIIEDEPSDSLIMVMPIAKYGNLIHYIESQKPDEKNLALCFFQICSAIKYIHSNNIVHRDIKPANILVIDVDNFCLADFSCSRKLSSSDEMLLDTKGTPAYLSPEECSGDIYSPKATDIWALGLSLYYAMFGYLPFELETTVGSELANLVLNVSHLLKEKELIIPECSEEVRDLISKLLVKDYRDRITIEEALNHPWFKKFQ
ncbi:CAMK family protein kinase [Trichomonas vaginalis G3]|uniref:CAMK family protein kinase n=1 Tax=Trichomonas vaginalis (strain ATCC PRA-98 / G3) TaxID=412133 RepID=A2FKQ7_TRIV3|nr:peptidyl-threonine phosphorylation [Trichomonas vaginalis G3]EAX94519.1 CAMK family protein kinase [Trichomonas vaginalis G3]KAI5501101.1 peptidyl-threonine phosphorylation [Trichomonas vaginalis G3]|eukprot:XP_001307449.1 CAMK family protein kinase [Trichomonas vaginalis G3]